MPPPPWLCDDTVFTRRAGTGMRGGDHVPQDHCTARDWSSGELYDLSPLSRITGYALFALQSRLAQAANALRPLTLSRATVVPGRRFSSG